MTTRLVTSCGDCPFGYYDTSAGGSMCAAIESGGGYTPETGRPDWCPLDAGPVTVRLDGQCWDELSGVHCILPAHGDDTNHRGRINEDLTLEWDGKGNSTVSERPATDDKEQPK